MKKGDCVEVVQDLSAEFPVDALAEVMGVSERGDFTLGKYTPHGVVTESFGFAYQSCVKVSERRGLKEGKVQLGGVKPPPTGPRPFRAPVGQKPQTEVGEELRGEREIRENRLETFDNPHPDQQFVISILAPELYTHCPRTGYPDFGQVSLVYIPDKRCCELKSWKLFLNKFAGEKHFHEDLTGKIFKDLWDLLDPLWLRVRIDFNPRGNVSTRVAFEQSKLPQTEIPWKLIEDTPPVRL